MNQLIAMSSEMTMGTREIAELLGKQHSNIKISAERLAASGVIGTLAPQEFTHLNNTYVEYRLNKRDSLILVAQNCPELTAAIVDRWQELEANQAHQLPNFSDQVAAARAWADEVEKKLRAEEMLAIAEKKAEFSDRYMDATGTHGFRQVAKTLGIKESELRAFLLDNEIMYRLGGKLTAYANHIEAGRFIQRAGVAENEHAYTESRFTANGVTWLAGEIASSKTKALLESK